MGIRFYRKNRPAPPDMWPISLADLMTTLMCFFVLILAIATIDKQKFQVVSENLADSLGVKPPPAPVQVQAQPPAQAQPQVQAPPGPPAPGEMKASIQPPAPATRSLFSLQADLARMAGGQDQALDVKLRPDSVSVDLKGAIFFLSGQAELTPKAQEILTALARPLIDSGHPLTVEGHTDNLPIHSPVFPSNWELSAARAASVARFLMAQGLPPQRVRVAGLADTRPVAPNTDRGGRDIPENQARNRRVTLIIHPTPGDR